MIKGAESNGVKFVTLTINKSSTIALPAVRNFYFVLQPSILTPVDCYEHTVNPTTQVETVRNRHDLSTLVTDVITVGNANTPENGQVLSNYAMYMLKDIYFEFICVNSQNSISGSVETFNITDFAYNTYALAHDGVLDRYVYGMIDNIFETHVHNNPKPVNPGYYVTSLKEFDNTLIELNDLTEKKFQEIPRTPNLAGQGDSFRSYMAHQILISRYFNNRIIKLSGFALGTQVIINVKLKVIGIPKVGEHENIYGI